MAQKIPVTSEILTRELAIQGITTEDRVFDIEGIVDKLSLELSALYDRIDELEMELQLR